MTKSCDYYVNAVSSVMGSHKGIQQFDLIISLDTRRTTPAGRASFRIEKVFAVQ